MTRAADDCDDEWVGDVIADAVDHPAAVVEANADGAGGSFTLEYADGRVDSINYYVDAKGIGNFLRCTIVGPGGAAFCRGDTNRSGATDIVDLLTVLADWGVCLP